MADFLYCLNTSTIRPVPILDCANARCFGLEQHKGKASTKQWVASLTDAYRKARKVKGEVVANNEGAVMDRFPERSIDKFPP